MIGASDVGSVQPLVKAGARVSKGDEVGVFAMGGSLVATVFRRGAVAFDADLLRHSARGCEVGRCCCCGVVWCGCVGVGCAMWHAGAWGAAQRGAVWPWVCVCLVTLGLSV